MNTRTNTEDGTREVLALLSIPALDGLSQAQVRGQACVWDGITLAPGTAVDLGPRRRKRLDGHYDWYPRACRRCFAQAADGAVRDHAGSCEQCADEAARCRTRTALEQLMREGR